MTRQTRAAPGPRLSLSLCLFLGLALPAIAAEAPAPVAVPGAGVEFIACSLRGHQGVVEAVTPGRFASLYRIRVLPRDGGPARQVTVTDTCFRALPGRDRDAAPDPGPAADRPAAYVPPTVRVQVGAVVFACRPE